MNVVSLTGVGSERWRTSSVEERLGALQRLENERAVAEERPALTVSFIPESAYQDDYEREGWRGVHVPDGHVDTRGVLWDAGLYVNRQLVENPLPYKAVNTLLHESRHAYQSYVVHHPETAHADEPLKDWLMNLCGGYLGHESNHHFYRYQPVEVDANRTADAVIRLIYAELSEDSSRDYLEYSALRLEENQDNLNFAKRALRCKTEDEVIAKSRAAMEVEYIESTHQTGMSVPLDENGVPERNISYPETSGHGKAPGHEIALGSSAQQLERFTDSLKRYLDSTGQTVEELKLLSKGFHDHFQGPLALSFREELGSNINESILPHLNNLGALHAELLTDIEFVRSIEVRSVGERR